MPAMREQLETFVQSLGRTMTQAADRLEHVDDRLHHVEQQSRAQTEILAMSRAELDRQGRALGGIETQMQSLESAIAQLVAAADRTQALLRDVEERKVRTANAVWIAITAAGIAVVCAVISALR
jgi:chromosome segregation ATPase